MSERSSDTPTSTDPTARRVLITGANKSLGRETARRLTEAGR